MTTYRVSASYLNGPKRVVVETTDYYKARASHTSQVLFGAGNGHTIFWEELDEDGNVIEQD